MVTLPKYGLISVIRQELREHPDVRYTNEEMQRVSKGTADNVKRLRRDMATVGELREYEDGTFGANNGYRPKPLVQQVPMPAASMFLVDGYGRAIWSEEGHDPRLDQNIPVGYPIRLACKEINEHVARMIDIGCGIVHDKTSRTELALILMRYLQEVISKLTTHIVMFDKAAAACKTGT